MTKAKTVESKEAEKEPVDPVGASFLGMCDLLEGLTKTQPGIAGPEALDVIARIRAQWSPAEPEPEPVPESGT